MRLAGPPMQIVPRRFQRHERITAFDDGKMQIVRTWDLQPPRRRTVVGHMRIGDRGRLGQTKHFGGWGDGQRIGLGSGKE